MHSIFFSVYNLFWNQYYSRQRQTREWLRYLVSVVISESCIKILQILLLNITYFFFLGICG